MERRNDTQNSKIENLMENYQSQQVPEEKKIEFKLQKWVTKSKKRMRLKFAMLLLGFITLIASITMTFSLISQGLIAFALIPLYLLSFIFISKYFNLTPYPLYENSLRWKKVENYREPVLKTYGFISIAQSRLFVGVILFIMGLIDLILMGYSIGHPGDPMIGTYLGTGTSFFLGGLSFFYPIGLPPLLIGIGLIIYRFTSAFWGRISVSENLYYFHEIRHIRPWLTEIRKKDVEGYRFQNNHIGPKIIWIILFIPIIFLTLQFGFSIYNHPLAENQILPILMTVTGLVDLIAMLILVFFPQYYIEMATKEKLFELWVNPLDYNQNVKKDLGEILKGKLDQNKESEKLEFHERGTRSFFRLFFGLFLLIVSIISGSFYVLFGTVFFIIGGIYGIINIFQALFNDFNKETTLCFDKDKKKLEMNRTIYFRNKFQSISFKNAENYSFEYYPIKLEVADIIFGFSISLVVIINTMQGLFLSDYSSLGSIIDLIATSLICISILTLIFIYFCIPQKHLNISSGLITYRIKWGNENNKEKSRKDTSKFLQSLKITEYSKENKKIFIIRAITLLSIFILSIIIALQMI